MGNLLNRYGHDGQWQCGLFLVDELNGQEQSHEEPHALHSHSKRSSCDRFGRQVQSHICVLSDSGGIIAVVQTIQTPIAMTKIAIHFMMTAVFFRNRKNICLSQDCYFTFNDCFLSTEIPFYSYDDYFDPTETNWWSMWYYLCFQFIFS